MKMARSIVFIARKWNWLAPIRHIIKPVCIWVVTVKMALILWVSAYWEICFHVEHFICGLGHIWKRNIQVLQHLWHTLRGKTSGTVFPPLSGGRRFASILYDFPREIFARISIFQPIFAISGIFQRLHRVCLMGANTSKPLSAYNAHHELYFDGSPSYVSHFRLPVRSLENRW